MLGNSYTNKNAKTRHSTYPQSPWISAAAMKDSPSRSHSDCSIHLKHLPPFLFSSDLCAASGVHPRINLSHWGSQERTLGGSIGILSAVLDKGRFTPIVNPDKASSSLSPPLIPPTCCHAVISPINCGLSICLRLSLRGA